MINFNLVELIHIFWMLDFYERSATTSAAKPQGVGGLIPSPEHISEFDKDHGRQIVEEVGKLAKALGLKTTKNRLSHFTVALRFNLSEADYRTEIRVLRDALKDDLVECHFYHYPRSKLDVLMKFLSAWNGIAEAFPLVKLEALAATDCYALGHNTACVFHIMRVAEYGLRALARERKIQLPRKKPVDWGTWQELLRELTKEATKIGETASPGSAKDNALSFYSGAISDLNAFKDEYRNQVMHVRKEYDEHQALRSLVKVHAFMERVSEKMSHKHHRVRWGLKFRKAA
jgi:hypothetical protein